MCLFKSHCLDLNLNDQKTRHSIWPLVLSVHWSWAGLGTYVTCVRASYFLLIIPDHLSSPHSIFGKINQPMRTLHSQSELDRVLLCATFDNGFVLKKIKENSNTYKREKNPVSRFWKIAKMARFNPCMKFDLFFFRQNDFIWSGLYF